MSYLAEDSYEGCGAISADAPPPRSAPAAIVGRVRRRRFRSLGDPTTIAQTPLRVPHAPMNPFVQAALPQTGGVNVGTGGQNTITLPPPQDPGTPPPDTTTTIVGGSSSQIGTGIGQPVVTTVYICADGSQWSSPGMCPSTPPHVATQPSAPQTATSIPWLWIGAGALALLLITKD